MPQLDDMYVDSAITIYVKYKYKLLILVGISIIIAIISWQISSMWLGLIAFVGFSVSIPSLLIGKKIERNIQKEDKSKGSRKKSKKLLNKKESKLR